MTLRRRSLRAAAGGAVVGVVLSCIILALYLVELRSGLTPASAGYGAGLWSWLASVPFGLIGVWLVATSLELLHVTASTSANMVLIVVFGVVGNWTLIGAMVGALFGWYRRFVPA